MSYGYIYKTTNLRNGHVYVGQKHGTYNPSYLGSGKILKRSVKKYGKTSFSVIVLCECENQEALNILEKFHIQDQREKITPEKVYNISGGGEAPMVGLNHTEEAKAKMRLKQKRGIEHRYHGRDFSGPSNPHFGRKHTDEAKRKMSIAHKKYVGPLSWLTGRKRTAEEVEKNRLGHKGLITSQSRNDIISEILVSRGLFYKELPVPIRNIAQLYRSDIFLKRKTLRKCVSRFCEHVGAPERAIEMINDYKKTYSFFREN